MPTRTLPGPPSPLCCVAIMGAMRFERRNSEAHAGLICGNVGSDAPKFGVGPKYFPYRSSMYIPEFFRDMDTGYEHDGSTRHRWVADVIDTMLDEAHEGPAHPRCSAASSTI